VLGAEEDDDLCRLRVAQRIREGWHLLSTVLNLLGDLGRSPDLVLSNVHQRGGLPGAFAVSAMTMGTPFIAKQDCTGHLIALCVGGKCRRGKHSGDQEDT